MLDCSFILAPLAGVVKNAPGLDVARRIAASPVVLFLARLLRILLRWREVVLLGEAQDRLGAIQVQLNRVEPPVWDVYPRLVFPVQDFLSPAIALRYLHRL